MRRTETGDKFTDDYTFARAVPGIFIAKGLMAAGTFVVSSVLVPVCLLGRRPWLVTAKQVGRARRTHVWQVAGNRQSRELVARVAATLHEGRRLSAVGVEFSEPSSSP